MRTRLTFLAALAAGLCLAGIASAAPIGPTPGADSAASLVEKVHGCHRSCAHSSSRGWHRHVGPYCEPVFCDRGGPVYRSYRSGPICRQECVSIAGVRVCETKCR